MLKIRYIVFTLTLLTVLLGACSDYDICLRSANNLGVSPNVCETENGVKKVIAVLKLRKQTDINKLDQIIDSVKQPKLTEIDSQNELKKIRKLYDACRSTLLKVKANCNNSEQLGKDWKETQ